MSSRFSASLRDVATALACAGGLVVSGGCHLIFGYEDFVDQDDGGGPAEGGSGAQGAGDPSGGGGEGAGPACSEGCSAGDSCFPGDELIACGANGDQCLECDQNDPCRADACVDGACSWESVTGPCPGGVCQDGSCLLESCADDTLNGNETDIDCGGPDCDPCLPGSSCEGPTDCVGGLCEDGVCGCGTGFVENPPGSGNCQDIDECLAGSDNCDANATCSNSPGSFTCLCNGGFSGSGVTCADDDECALGTDNCSANAACSNQFGSFSCACNGGFSGDGVTCNDIDECAQATDNCDASAICMNLSGTFDCSCPPSLLDVNGDGSLCLPFQSCRALLDAQPGLASGTYTIDPDGGGATPPRQVHCDMVFDGGGWTNLDFSLNRVVLENGIHVQCATLTATPNAFTCQDPLFNGSPTGWLYHYFCDGSDLSGNYILEHMGPVLGHRSYQAIAGWSALSQSYDGTPSGSVNEEEYCYVSGQQVLYTTPLCAPYNLGSGNCVVGVFTLTHP